MELFFINLFIYLTGSIKIFCQKDKKKITFLLFFIVFFVSALRVNDLDYEIYKKIYLNPGKVEMEIGYLYLVKFFNYFTKDYSKFLFFLNFVITLFLYKFYSYKNKLTSLTLAIYFCNIFFYYQMNQIRNLLGIMIFYYGFINYEEKRKIIYILYVISSLFFHTSCILLVVIFFLVQFPNIVNSKKILIITLLSSFVLGSGKILINLLEIIVNLNIPIISNKINTYIYHSYYGISYGFFNLNANSNFYKSFIINIIVVLLYRKFNSQYERKLIFIYNFGVSIFIIFNLISYELSSRLGYSLMFVEPLIISKIGDKIYKKQKYIYIIFLFLYILGNYFLLNKVHPKLININTYY